MYIKKYNIFLLFFFTSLLFTIIGCTNFPFPNQEDSESSNGIKVESISESTVENSLDDLPEERGEFTDDRDRKTYSWARLKDGKKWMTKDLDYETKWDSWNHHKKKAKDYKTHGRLYRWQAWHKVCPTGWYLPSDEDWWNMISHYGGASNMWKGQEKNVKDRSAGKAAYKVLIQGGSIGFSAMLGGEMKPIKEFKYFGERGTYWTSTETKGGYNTYTFSSLYKRIERRFGQGIMGYSCRCIQD